MSKSETARFLICIGSKSDELQQIHRDVAIPRFLCALGGGSQRRLKKRAPQSRMCPDTYVVEDAHFPEQIQVLEGPGDPEPGPGMSGGGGNVDAVKHNPARI